MGWGYTWKDCFNNFIMNFKPNSEELIVYIDNSEKETIKYVVEVCKTNGFTYKLTNDGNAYGFYVVAKDALDNDDDTIIYFVESDYLHRKESKEALFEIFTTYAKNSYATLYDHPDKYIDGANPYVQGGGEMTRVMLSKSSHWKVTNSTTMTFASKVKTLRKTENILREYTQGSYPRDFDMFVHLYNSAHYLVTPIPGYSTHGETAWLTPLINWKKI